MHRLADKRSAKIDALKTRLKQCISDNDLYYAHQLYKTIYARFDRFVIIL